MMIIDELFMRPSSLGGGRILRLTLSVRLSVCPSRSCIVSRWLKISSNFFIDPVAIILAFWPERRYPIPAVTPSAGR